MCCFNLCVFDKFPIVPYSAKRNLSKCQQQINNLDSYLGKRSELQKTEHQNSKRTLKKFQSIRTSKVSFQFITTTTIRTSKRTQKLTFDVLILPMVSKKIRTLKIKISTTYGVLHMVTKVCGGLGQGQLGQVRLGQVRLGQARLGSITISQVKLGQVNSGQKFFKDLFNKMPQVLMPQVVKM